MKENIPSSAVMITFCFGKLEGHFYVWRAEEPWKQPSLSVPLLTTLEDLQKWENSHYRYQWSALGANGEEETQELAIKAARKWVLNQITKHS